MKHGPAICSQSLYHPSYPVNLIVLNKSPFTQLTPPPNLLWQERDNVVNLMDQLIGIAFLLQYSIHFTAYGQGIGIWHCFFQHNRWTKRARTIHTLPKEPLSTISALLLPVPGCYILCHSKPKHMIHCVCWVDSMSTFTNNNSQLNFPIKLLKKRK